MEKSIAEAINGMLDARAFDKIDTDAEDAHLGYLAMAASISFTALSRPTEIARETIE
jgi:hypothetical protein